MAQRNPIARSLAKLKRKIIPSKKLYSRKARFEKGW